MTSALRPVLILAAAAAWLTPALAAPDCAAPDPGAAHIVAIAAERGRAVANVALGGRPARLVEIRVAPGGPPLALALSAREPTIWRIAGATQRIAFAYVAADASPAAVQGLGAAQVRFAPGEGCMPALSPRGSDDADIDDAHVRGALLAPAFAQSPRRFMRLRIANVIAAEGVAHVDAAVAGTIAVPREGVAAALWEAAGREGPLAHVDPESLVASAPARRLSPLPGHAGLAQLLEAGAIEVAGVERSGHAADSADPIARALAAAFARVDRVEMFGPGVRPARKPVPNAFLILQPIRMPDELPRIRWLLGHGVPIPDGDLSRLCILRQMSEEPVAGGACGRRAAVP